MRSRMPRVQIKKIADGALHLIVPERIGCCRIETVPAADIPAWLADGGIV